MTCNISVPHMKTPRLTSSRAGIYGLFLYLLFCVLLTRPSDDNEPAGLSLVFLVRCFCLLYRRSLFPSTTAIRLATDVCLKPRLMARNRLPLYTLPSPTDPHYHQPLRVSPGLPLGRPQSFWIASPSLELLPNNRIHKLGLIFNSTVEASDLKILIQMNYVIWNFRNLIFKK